MGFSSGNLHGRWWSAVGDILKSVSVVRNQAVLLRGINDTRVKMWKLCETVQESYVRPYYLFNCSYRNPQYKHMRVPIAVGREGDNVVLRRPWSGEEARYPDAENYENQDFAFKKY